MIPYDAPLPFLLTWLFLVGACIGSFLNVCIYRIPRHERLRDQLTGLWSPPSSCPGCGQRIRSYDNVPILGWLWLRGRCRVCRCRISKRYPVIELTNGLLFVVVYWLEVPSGFQSTLTDSNSYSHLGPQIIDGLSTTAWLNWRFAYHMVLIESLFVASMIDWDLRIIPDATTLPAMLIGVIGGVALGQVFLVPIWFQEPSIVSFWDQIMPEWATGWFSPVVLPAWIRRWPHLHGLAVSLAGLIVGGGLVWGVRIIGRWVLKREAMGFGDVILMASIGSFLGWQPTVVAFFIAPLCALVVVALTWLFRRQREIPFGPYLSFAALLVMVFWKQIGPHAERIFQLGPFLPLLVVFMAAMLYLTLQAMQLLKRLLGFPLYPEAEWEERWTSADQLFHFSGEQVDQQQGRWRTESWPGSLSGRGQSFERQWRHPDRS